MVSEKFLAVGGHERPRNTFNFEVSLDRFIADDVVHITFNTGIGFFGSGVISLFLEILAF